MKIVCVTLVMHLSLLYIFFQVLTRILHRFKSCTWLVFFLLALVFFLLISMVFAGNKSWSLSSVNHSAKKIDHYHHHLERDINSFMMEVPVI